MLNHTRGEFEDKLVHGISQVDLAVVWFDSGDTSVSEATRLAYLELEIDRHMDVVMGVFAFQNLSSGILSLLVILLTTVSKSSSLIPVITLHWTFSWNSSNVNPLTVSSAAVRSLIVSSSWEKALTSTFATTELATLEPKLEAICVQLANMQLIAEFEVSIEINPVDSAVRITIKEAGTPVKMPPHPHPNPNQIPYREYGSPS